VLAHEAAQQEAQRAPHRDRDVEVREHAPALFFGEQIADERRRHRAEARLAHPDEGPRGQELSEGLREAG
jgi:hypothetical protein